MPWRCRSPSNASGAEGAVITGPAIPTYDVSAIGLYILDILGQPIEAIPPGGRAFYIDEINLAVAGRSDPDEVARFFLDRGVKVCALTMGDEGSLIVSVDGSRVRMPAFAVSISDTSGCGDSYTAGFIAGLHRGWNLEECALRHRDLGAGSGQPGLERQSGELRGDAPGDADAAGQGSMTSRRPTRLRELAELDAEQTRA